MKKDTHLPFPLLILLSFLFSFSSFAQQSSKSKAANKLYEKGNEIKIKNATKINTANLEFSPTYYQNGIVYASSRNQESAKDENIDESYFELFYADLDGKGLPGTPKNFALNIASNLHQGPVTFNRAGNVIYFTRNNFKRGQPKSDNYGFTHLKIYEAKKGADDWKNAKELSFCSDDYSVAHPTLSVDGKKLYFTSDMPGGYGGMDIYVVENVMGKWTKPINLGEEINTSGNEVFPFMHSSGHLIFSSDGYQGAGGLDLYMINISDRKWGRVTNLGEPFNSKGDDLGLILNPEGNHGYFSSDRKKGLGKDDIYMFEASKGLWGKTRPDVFTPTIKVFDEETQEVIGNAEIRIFEQSLSNDGQAYQLYQTTLLPLNDGTGNLAFRMIRREKGSLGDTDDFTDKKGNAEIEFVGEKKYILFISKDGYKNKEIVFSTLGNIANEELEISLLKTACKEINGVAKIESSQRNLANTIIQVTNTCNDDEILIMSDRKGHFNFCLPNNCEYQITGIKDNFENGVTKISTDGNDDFLDIEIFLKKVETPKPLIQKGDVIILQNLTYDFNKSYIRSSDSKELDELVALMLRYPAMKIELVAHTDARGAAPYNQLLSRRRAQSAKDYLVSHGIRNNRITAEGYGESQIRNNCTDGVRCTNEEHLFNRRIEVIVIEN